MSTTAKNIQIACPHCGVVLETEDSIAGAQVDCPECGKAFLATPIKPEPAPTVPDARRKRLPASRSPKKCWPWVVGIVLIVAAVGVAIWWSKGTAMRSAQPSPVADTESPETVAPVSKKAPGTLPPPSGKTKSTESVNPVLSFQTVREYCKRFGGRESPETYSFAATRPVLHPDFNGDAAYYHVRRLAEGGSVSLAGNPISFYRIGTTWARYETASGEGDVFVRDDRLSCDDDPDRIAIRNELCSAVLFYARSQKEFARDLGVNLNKMDKQVSDLVGADGNISQNAVVELCMDSLRQGRLFPAPVVFAPTTNSVRFCYLNDSGRPSALRWGGPTSTVFWCFEGDGALRGYAKCLRELRETLLKNTEIAKEEGVSQWKSSLSPKNTPEVYIGDTRSGTRERGSVEYEFVVESQGKEISYMIKETGDSKRWTLFHGMDLETLDEELAFFSQFETKESTEKAFAPLYCFLTQQKILFEESEQDAARVARRFGGGGGTDDGKKPQHLAFSPIGPQTQNSRVELDATSESGGKVVFSVESGPGKIDGKMLTFTGTGKVLVRARQWGNDKWKSATATQEVEVKYQNDSDPSDDVNMGNPEDFQRIPSRRENETTREAGTSGQSSGFGSTGVAAPSTRRQKNVTPELKNMAGILLDLKTDRSAANLSKLEKEWKMLPPEPKRLLQKNVMWIGGAMLLQHGKTEALAQRKALLDTRALATAVSDECPACHGRGKTEENCRTCGGTGRCAFCHGSGRTPRMNGQTGPCPKCNSSGRCLDCLAGKKQARCRMCGGNGRMLSEHKCQNVIEENIAEALRICRGEE